MLRTPELMVGGLELPFHWSCELAVPPYSAAALALETALRQPEGGQVTFRLCCRPADGGAPRGAGVGAGSEAPVVEVAVASIGLRTLLGYGGDLTGRSRFLLTLVEQVRARVPALGIGVRLSITDPGPFRTGESGTGERHPDAGPVFDLVEATELVRLLGEAGVRLICTTVGSPYWSPHAQRPAWFPPSDGYVPPRDPMVDAAAMLGATRDLRAAAPSGTAVVGTGFTYFQQFLANVAQAVLDAGWMDFAGLGRMVLSYPELPADVLGGRSLNTRLICRTFSDCTTAPRNGLVSGCYPLDPFYKERPERATLVQVKRSSRG
jgi:hypothetical protein